MAQDASKIHAGPARMFVGVTAGATGLPPTYIAHTDGVPATGTEVGATDGDAVFKYSVTQEEIEIEQSLAAVDVYPTGEMASIDVTCKEQTYLTLKAAYGNVGSESVAGGDAFYFGGGTSILSPTKQCVMLTSRQRNAPTKFIVSVLYLAYVPTAVELPFRKKGQTLYKVTFKGLADLTRNDGDRLGYYRFEK